MIRRHLLRSGVAAVFLCGFAQGSFAAAKTDEPVSAGVHAPTTEWSVAPIGAKSADGSQFCSMKNTYQNGQTLVFARDTKGSNSIALDLHKDLFEAGHHYNVKLRSGVLTRPLQALAATPQVLAMEMGVDTIFYGALARKHNVIFTIQDEKYGFELDVSAAEALSALGRCTESLQPGSNVSFTASTFPLGKVSDDAFMLQTQEPFSDEGEDQPVTAEPSKKHGNKAAKATKNQKLKGEIAEMQDQNRDLLLKNEKLREQIAEQDTAPAKAPEQSPANAARDEMKSEIASEILNMKVTGHLGRTGQHEVPAAPVASSVVMKPMAAVDNTDLKKLLKASQVASGDLTADNSNSLHWSSDDLYGSAQALPMQPGKSLTEMANSYIKKASSVCSGEFAQKLGAVKRAGTVDILEAEITCLDGKNNAAAAILFVGGQGKFSVITQEGTIDQLDTAMSDRDAIVSTASDKVSD